MVEFANIPRLALDSVYDFRIESLNNDSCFLTTIIGIWAVMWF